MPYTCDLRKYIQLHILHVLYNSMYGDKQGLAVRYNHVEAAIKILMPKYCY